MLNRLCRMALDETQAVDRAATKILDSVAVEDIRREIVRQAKRKAVLTAIENVLWNDPRCEPSEFAKLGGMDMDEMMDMGIYDHDVQGVIELIIKNKPDVVDALIDDARRA